MQVRSAIQPPTPHLLPMPRQTVLMSWNSASPYLLCSRPSPLCFTPPKGATCASRAGGAGEAGRPRQDVELGQRQHLLPPRLHTFRVTCTPQQPLEQALSQWVLR